VTLEDILQDIHALEDELRAYERKYNVLSETFYEAYVNGEEPPDETWVQDWTAWASAYQLWLRRREQYRVALAPLRAAADSLASVIARTARHNPFSSLSEYEHAAALPLDFPVYPGCDPTRQSLCRVARRVGPGGLSADGL